MIDSQPDATRRFGDRVANYVAARPGYPPQIVERLVAIGGWQGPVTVADLGSGTGLSALPFLDAGHRVLGVEPNAEMRAAAGALLADRPGFVPVDGRAEATGLKSRSIDLVIAAQAFHWFDVEATAREVRRILRPGGIAAVVWNLRRTGGTRFLDGYEALLREYGTDYSEVSARYADPDALRRFFGGPFIRDDFEYLQRFDRDGLRARLLSSSYTPPAGHPRHAPMLAALDTLFERTAVDGLVDFAYDTCLYVAALDALAVKRSRRSR
jgi:SAM-dependent methyltransferase